MLRSETPVPQDVTLFTNRVIADIINSDEVVSEQAGPLIQSDWGPY